MSLQVNESENTVSDVSNLTGMPENRIINVTINKLPARTWNRLKMNEAVVQNVEVPVAKTY